MPSAWLGSAGQVMYEKATFSPVCVCGHDVRV